MRLRSPYDREILLLALPALGALAAEPLYVLVDTAIVGHLGTTPARLAGDRRDGAEHRVHDLQLPHLRHHGAGRAAARRGARRAGRRASARRRCGWRSAIGVGPARAARAHRARGGVADGRRGRGQGRRGRSTCGSPRSARRCSCSRSAAQGFLRGIGDLKTPLYILLAAHSANVVLELLFVYGFDWGLKGSAWGTVLAQLGHGAGLLRGAVPGGPGTSASGQDAPADADRLRDRGAHHRADRLVPGRQRGARPDRRGVAGRAPDRLPAVGLPRARARRDRDRRAGDDRAHARRRATPTARGPPRRA